MTTATTRTEHYQAGCVSVTVKLPKDPKAASSIHKTAMTILNGFRQHAENQHTIPLKGNRFSGAASPAVESDASSTVEECPPYRQRWKENLTLLKTGQVPAKPIHIIKSDLTSPKK